MHIAIEKFIRILREMHIDVTNEQILVIDRGVPHTPGGMQRGMMAIYAFQFEGSYVKIGKVGMNSNARFVSQHYIPTSSQSNLARSLLADKAMNCYGLHESTVGDWIKNNMRRIDIFIDSKLGIWPVHYSRTC